MDTIEVSTPDRTALLDVTDLVSRKVKERGMESGLCIVQVPHTTAGVLINEGADPAVMKDVAETLERLVPWKGRYLHGEGNSAAHIKSILVGSSVHVLVENGNWCWAHGRESFCVSSTDPGQERFISSF